MTPEERDVLIRDNDPLAKFIAARWQRRFQSHSLLFDDLYQAGRVGLIRAVDTHDAARIPRIPFGAYAGICIRRMIRDEIERMMYAVRVPQAVRRAVSKGLGAEMKRTDNQLSDDIQDGHDDFSKVDSECDMPILTRSLTTDQQLIISFRLNDRATWRSIGEFFEKSDEWARVQYHKAIAAVRDDLSPCDNCLLKQS